MACVIAESASASKAMAVERLFIFEPSVEGVKSPPPAPETPDILLITRQTIASIRIGLAGSPAHRAHISLASSHYLQRLEMPTIQIL